MIAADKRMADGADEGKQVVVRFIPKQGVDEKYKVSDDQLVRWPAPRCRALHVHARRCSRMQQLICAQSRIVAVSVDTE